LEFLDPRRIQHKDQNRVHLKTILTLLIQCNRLCERDADDILNQYNDFVDEIVEKNMERFIAFKPSVQRLDQLMYDTMAHDENYSKLWPVVRTMLVLSHGQASVERGFSVNAQIEVENMTENTFKARRIICDHIEHVGGINKIDITNKKLLFSVATARSKYMAYLDEQKQKSAKEKAENSKKRIHEEIEELKVKKRRIEKDLDALLKSADEFAEKAEKSHSVTCITKSNSFRRTAKEKTAEIEAVELQWENKLLQLKNN